MAKSKPQPKVKAKAATRLKAAQNRPVSDSHSRPSGKLAAAQNTEREGLRKTVASNAALRKLNAKLAAPTKPSAPSSGFGLNFRQSTPRGGDATSTYGRLNDIIHPRK